MLKSHKANKHKKGEDVKSKHQTVPPVERRHNNNQQSSCKSVGCFIFKFEISQNHLETPLIWVFFSWGITWTPEHSTSREGKRGWSFEQGFSSSLVVLVDKTKKLKQAFSRMAVAEEKNRRATTRSKGSTPDWLTKCEATHMWHVMWRLLRKQNAFCCYQLTPLIMNKPDCRTLTWQTECHLSIALVIYLKGPSLSKHSLWTFCRKP